MKDIVLVGYGGNYFDIKEQLELQNYKILGYLDKKDKGTQENYLGADVENSVLNKVKLITLGGIGKSNIDRIKIFNIHKEKLVNLIFESAEVSKYSKIQQKSNVIIFHSSVIKSGVTINANVFINSGCIIGHHCTINENVQISLGVLVGGNSIIGRNTFIGMGARIFENVRIGKNCIVAANSLVTKDVLDNSLVIGINKIRRI